MKVLKRRVMPLLLCMALLAGMIGVYSPPAAVVYAAEDTEQLYEAENTEGTCLLAGTVYSMGYEFDVKPEVLEMNLTVTAVCKEDGTTVKMTSANGLYELELSMGNTYDITYSGYVGGRMANLNFKLTNYKAGADTANLIIRTKNVLGMGEVDKYKDQYPEGYVIRDLNSTVEAKYPVSIKLVPDEDVILARQDDTAAD